ALLRSAASESSPVVAAAAARPVIAAALGGEPTAAKIPVPAIGVLADRELRQRTLGLDAFRPWQRRANQRTMHGTLFEGPILIAWSGHRVGVKWLCGLGYGGLNRFGLGFRVDLWGTGHHRRWRSRCDNGLRFPSPRRFSTLVRVFGVARRASSLFDLVLDHRDDYVIRHAALTRTVVVQYVTETQPALLHSLPRIGTLMVGLGKTVRGCSSVSNRAHQAQQRASVPFMTPVPRTIDPGQRRFERPIVPAEQGLPRGRDGLVRNHASPLEPDACSGYEITPGVDEDIAVRQPIEERRQRLPHRRLAEYAHAPERLQAAGKAFRRAARQSIDDDSHRAIERLDAATAAVDETRNRHELQFRVPGFHHPERLAVGQEV